MSQIEAETVRKIAQLAHLELSAEELAYYQNQLASILDYMGQLQSVELSLPSDWRAELENPASPEREDHAVDSAVIDRVLQTAPRVVGTAFQVPRIIE